MVVRKEVVDSFQKVLETITERRFGRMGCGTAGMRCWSQDHYEVGVRGRGPSAR
jgi:hypothetical protein